MAYAKKTSKANEAFQKLKNDLAAGTAGNAYIFYGEETYLREYYLPPYCCVVFLYDTVEYKPNRTMKKLYKAVTDHVEAVEFRPADNSDLVVWIARRFKALGKEIDRQTAEYLIFTCGGVPPVRRGAPGELRRGGPHPGGSAENADRAHHDPGGFGQPAPAHLYRPDGH